MKKYTKTVICSIIAILLIYFTGTGFIKNNSVFISDFSMDGTKMTITTGNASSVGYIRSVSVKEKDNVAYLDFYGAFGGINGSIGAKNTFIIDVSQNITTIAVNDSENTYKEVLEKDSLGNWSRK